MEILYVWLGSYKEGQLNRQGLNFDNKFRFSCREKEKNIYEIEIKENANYIKNFFKPERCADNPISSISNITAIVGQNGSGKSSILDYIKEYMVYSEDSTRQPGLFIYIVREGNGDDQKHWIYHHPELQVTINVKMEGVSPQEFDMADVFQYESVSSRFSDYQEKMRNTSFIFFSNIFDQKEESASPHLLNISTNYLASMKKPPKQTNIILNDVQFHKYREIKRQIQFVFGMNNIVNRPILPFNVPKVFNIYFSPGFKRGIDASGFENSVIETLLKLHRSLKQMMGVDLDRKPLRFIAQNFLSHIHSEMILSSSINKIKVLVFDFDEVPISKFGFSASSVYIKVTRWLVKLAAYFKAQGDTDISNFAVIIESCAALMVRFYKFAQNELGGFDSNRNLFTISLQVEEMDQEEIRRLLELYEKCFIHQEFMEFLWREISSGEKALLNIYSRLYFASRRPEIEKQPEQDVVILIDEGEIYLHPHWQTRLLNNLIEYLPSILSNEIGSRQRNIQIILTSNSPFIVSDLPSSNMIFLKKDKTNGSSIVVDSLDEYNQTFAANIHSLLAHSFFMQDGLIGAFAKRKINDIVNLLVNGSIDTLWPYRKDIEKFINIVGEPVIRNKLSGMLQDKLAVRMLRIDGEIESLKARLAELERWKRDSNQP